MSNLRLSDPREAADLGGHMHVLWPEALADDGDEARGLYLCALPWDVAGDAGGCAGGGEAVGGEPAEGSRGLIWVRCTPLFGETGPSPTRIPPCASGGASLGRATRWRTRHVRTAPVRKFMRRARITAVRS